MSELFPVLLSLAISAYAAPLTPLSAASDAARRSAACAPRVPMEYSQSAPVPVRSDGGVRYRIMFYRAVGEGPADDDLQVQDHIIVAEFDLNGSAVDCKVPAAFPKRKNRFAPLGPMMSAATLKMTGEAYQEREAKLYTAIERAAGAFAAGKKDAKAAAAFRALFEAHAEPALKEHYRALSPEFFAWAGMMDKP